MNRHESNPVSTPVEDDTTTDEKARDEFHIAWLLHGLTPLEQAPRLPQRSQTKDCCCICGEYNGRLDRLGACRECAL